MVVFFCFFDAAGRVPLQWNDSEKQTYVIFLKFLVDK